MDFSFTDEQQAIAALAKQILGDGAGHERLRQLERSGRPRFDADLWRRLAEAGLVGLALPEAQGGGGLGFVELMLVLEQVGRTTAPVPYVDTAVVAGPAVAAFGSAAQRAALLPGVVAGTTILTAALTEGEGDPLAPTTTATRTGDGWVLDGTKLCVPAAQLAQRVLVPAATGVDGVGVFLVDPTAPGVVRTALETTSGQPESRLDLGRVRVAAGDVLGEATQGRPIVAWMVERTQAALAAVALGCCEEALRLTADYVKTRKQFDQPIAMFQAVAHRTADAYIDTEGIRLTVWQAASRIAAAGSAPTEVALAKFWAAEAGHRIVHAAQHLHGGIGVDRDYPLHRYFLYARQLELTLGGVATQLRTIGRWLADEPADGAGD
jgi:alkylation response protein AidB-like acyl-CoA dehydrogenase